MGEYTLKNVSLSMTYVNDHHLLKGRNSLITEYGGGPFDPSQVTLT